MYLKSLTLKGFKSFADRAHMTFEPGLTVIVGPNGSGKSNISDSILWVLGEQSAKQLRGQAMEDVIFSGSSARKPVGVAEVTLVLDNSDHMLPVDFDEVAITRRMYRSGESEYLINSSPCRLMDIQDILHDSGLGKDTHSIISQGKLDAILQSRPEERRALIEEAAGISKHKRRKERALKKIKSMDEHLTRARDINKEIARQLRPLERQVDRARKYKELSSRANELTQMLAVDELRSLQSQWNDLESRSKEGAAELELAQYRLGEKERELEKLQVMLEEKGLFVGDLGEQRRHMQDVVGRINSDMRLLEEKGHNMVSRLSDIRGQISSSEHQRRRVVEELEDARAQLEEVTGAHMQAQEDVDAAGPAAAELHERRVALDNQISQLTREQRDVQRVADNAALELAKVKDSLSNAEVEDNMYASRLEQIDEQLEEVTASLESRRDRAEELEGALEEARQAQVDAREATEAARAALKDLRARESEERNKLSEVRSELASQKKLDARMADSSPLVSRLVGALGDDVLGRLGDVLEAPRELEGLVEQLLAGDIDALLFDDTSSLERAGRAALDQKKASGEALLVARGVSGSAAAEGAAGSRLVDRLSVRAGYGPIVEALLGGYYVVDDLAAALAAPVVDGVTYVTPDGARVACGGLVRVGLDAGEASGALERKRRIRELEGLEPDLAAVFEHVSNQVVEANAAVEEAGHTRARSAGCAAARQGIDLRALLFHFLDILLVVVDGTEVERLQNRLLGDAPGDDVPGGGVVDRAGQQRVGAVLQQGGFGRRRDADRDGAAFAGDAHGLHDRLRPAGVGDRERDVPEPHRGGAEHLHVLVVEHHAGLTDLHELQTDQLAGDDRVAVAKHDDDVRLPQGVRRGLILVGDQREGVEHRLVVLVDHRTHQLPRGDLLHRGGEAGVVRLPLGHPDAVAEIQKALVAHVLAQADDRGAARVDFSGNRVQVQRPDAVQVFDQIGGCGLFTSGKRGKD